jgi:hypothetical protein
LTFLRDFINSIELASLTKTRPVAATHCYVDRIGPGQQLFAFTLAEPRWLGSRLH